MTPQTLALAWIAGTVALFVLFSALAEIAETVLRRRKINKRLARIGGTK